MCLAVSCGHLWSTYFCFFDTSSLLSRGSTTLRTCQYQTRHHALALAWAGLPQAMACSVLMHAVLHGPTRTRTPCASSGDNVGKGHTKDGPSDMASYHSRFALPVPRLKFGGCGLSRSKGTSGSWPTPYSGKSLTVQHLADDWRTALQPRGRYTPGGCNWPVSPFFTSPT